MLVHAHSRWVMRQTAEEVEGAVADDFSLNMAPTMPLWQFYLTRYVRLYLHYRVMRNTQASFRKCRVISPLKKNIEN